MKNKTKFYIIVLINLILVLLDGLLTYIGTPDLKLEANPLVSVFGLGWASLAIANIVVFSLFVYLCYHSFCRYKTRYYKSDNLKAYTSNLFFNRPDKFKWIWYKLPKNWSPFIAMIGYSFAYGAIGSRLVLVIEWLLYLTNSPLLPYSYSFKQLFPFGRFSIFFGLAIMIVMAFVWLNKQYKKNNKYFSESL